MVTSTVGLQISRTLGCDFECDIIDSLDIGCTFYGNIIDSFDIVLTSCALEIMDFISL